MSKAVQFDSYGGINVLKVRDAPSPVPGPGSAISLPVAGLACEYARTAERLVPINAFPETSFSRTGPYSVKPCQELVSLDLVTRM